MTAPPASTYRLQIRPGFDLDAAAEVVPYLRDLGVGWAYLSPILQSAAGSAHGYDVVDPTRVDAARGGPEGFARFVAAARAAGLGVLVDIVPNHVGVADPVQNPWWWDVLRLGVSSPHAAAFDIDWSPADGRVRLPILGAELDEVLSAGEIAIDGDAGVARYFDHVLPLAPGSTDGIEPAGSDDAADVRAVLRRQHWELQHWRRGDAELNYRRFFTVTSLAGVRVEVPEVFDAAHVEVARWLREGLVDGLRIDHPDGLADPGGYLERLAGLAAIEPFDTPAAPATQGPEAGDVAARRCAPAYVVVEPFDTPAAPATQGPEAGAAVDRRCAPVYVVVEKILERGEELPGWWATDGTTGYDAMAEIDRVLVDPDGETPLDELDARLRAESGMPPSSPYLDLVHDAKRAVAETALQAEVRRLVRLLPAALRNGARDRGSDAEWADALAELLANFPVYRAYLPAGAEHLGHAARETIRRRPELTGATQAIARHLQTDPDGEFTRRFMQTTGPVMAKGVEDTTFYRHTRLTSLAEVGGDPSAFSLAVPGLHAAFARRQAAWPHALTALSTHDTKRSGDVRARLAVLAELPERWADALDRLRAIASTGHGPFDNLLWQAVVGVWPADAGENSAHADAELRERLTAYGIKAAREAKERTSWEDPDADFESRVSAVVDAALGAARPIVATFVAEIAPRGWSNALSAALLHLAGPGVPDVYQGTELWDFSLVDPDNRRAVDFAVRRALLARLDRGWMPDVDASGAAKLLLTSRALRLRCDRPELFTRYRDLPVVGLASGHAIAFDRGGAVAVATRLPARLARSGGWRDTAVLLPPGTWRDVLTGRTVPGGRAAVAGVLSGYPVALLVRTRP